MGGFGVHHTVEDIRQPVSELGPDSKPWATTGGWQGVGHGVCSVTDGMMLPRAQADRAGDHSSHEVDRCQCLGLE